MIFCWFTSPGSFPSLCSYMVKMTAVSLDLWMRNLLWDKIKFMQNLILYNRCQIKIIFFWNWRSPIVGNVLYQGKLSFHVSDLVKSTNESRETQKKSLPWWGAKLTLSFSSTLQVKSIVPKRILSDLINAVGSSL